MDIININATSDYEIGRHHGLARKEQIKHFLSDNLCRINKIRRTPLPTKSTLDFVRSCGEVIENELPCIWQEILGLKDGAEISIDEALILQLRRELQALDVSSQLGDCTTIVRDTQHGVLLGQTIDLPGNMSDQALVFRILHPEHPRCVVYTFNGLLGYVGFNEHIAIGINMIVADAPRVGVPSYLIVREMLKKTSIEACLDVIKNTTQSYARSFSITNGKNSVVIESTNQRIAFNEIENTAHTNHLIINGMKKYDKANFILKNNSLRRFSRALELLPSVTDTATMRSLLSDHENSTSSICVHEDADSRRISTAGSVVINVCKREMSATSGAPCKNSAQSIGLQ